MQKIDRRLKPLLGTFVEVAVTHHGSRSDVATTEAFKAIENIQNLLSFHDPDSELSRLNRSQGQEVILSSPSATVLRLARSMMVVSGHLFNCTVGGRLVHQGVLPNHRIGPTLETGNAQDIEIRGRRARLKRPVLITLDGIAKGFAVDGAIKILKYHGISGGWVNAGGDLRVFGSVQLPVQRRGLQGEFTDLGIFRNLALATSTRTLNRDPRFPGIILGSEEDFSGADTICTVSAPSAWLADALTKVAVLTPAILRHSMIAKLGGIQIFPS